MNEENLPFNPYAPMGDNADNSGTAPNGENTSASQLENQAATLRRHYTGPTRSSLFGDGPSATAVPAERSEPVAQVESEEEPLQMPGFKPVFSQAPATSGEVPATAGPQQYSPQTGQQAAQPAGQHPESAFAPQPSYGPANPKLVAEGDNLYSPPAPHYQQSTPVMTASRHRGPSWGGVVAISFLVAIVTMAFTLGGLWSVNLLGNGPRVVNTPPAATTAEVAPVVDSQAATADWKAVNEAVGRSVVLIQAVSGSGEGGTGSGVIIDDQAHILTNYHVVARSSAAEGGKLLVTLEDSRIYQAKLVGVDVTTDLAVIQLVDAPKDLTIARLGSSSNLEVGQQVAAIGAPLGLKSTMTTGIISALERPTVVSDKQIFNQAGGAVFTNAIQVDASINPGNSGGPLFDAQGRVIGINSSIMSISSSDQQQAGSIGLGFAIPIDLAKRVSAELISKGEVKHALIGVKVKAGYAQVGDARLTGAVVSEVEPTSKFLAAGLRAGDVILSIDGKPVVDSSNLIGHVRYYAPGDTATLQVARDGKRLEIQGELLGAE
ncbi:S1C family serine protease [Boudabousia marimammalium]|uniref:PDZ domain-containing protein n=1 Tax=Boudabousia marimammalium TaxID=156892 RepID=A0A1Q5PMF9_9ACTO|nr:trypsin-like peptidase domain-containing protein [Boudabousia marimammalium]OKL48712.1 hypothetical protein BM477_05825 [Boudabousia marimammalium]